MSSRNVWGPLKKLPQEKPFLVWDVETKPAYPGEPINTVWLGAALYAGSGNPEIYENENSFFERLFSDEFAGYWCYAHNASGFDFHFLIRFLVSRQAKWTGYRTGQRLFLTVGDREFYDSQAILRGSLASLGPELGLTVRKWAVPDDFYERIEHYDWKPYLADDCRSLYEAIDVTRRATADIGGVLRPTLASTAMTLYRAQHMPCEIETLDPWAPEPDEWRKAYLGGRVEVFGKTMGEGAAWDINSSFPFAMISPRGIPCEYLGQWKTTEIPAEPAICEATVVVPPSERHPPLGLIGSDRRLYFPTGAVTGSFCSEELEYCRDKYGAKSVQVKSAHLFKPRDIFRSYVDTLYEIRRTKKGSPLAYVAKLELNSLYGKTGMSRDREKIVCGSAYHDWPWNDKKAMRRFESQGITPSKRVISPDEFIYGIPERANFARYVMPQIAATITARARLALQRHLDTVGEASRYCDTDSIYVECDKSVLGDHVGAGLGKLKLEGEIEWGMFPAPKTYLVKWKNGELCGKAKGVRRTSPEQVKDFIDGKPVPVKRIPGIFEARRRFAENRIRSETQNKKATTWSERRHKDGRAFSVDELREKGVIP